MRGSEWRDGKAYHEERGATERLTELPHAQEKGTQKKEMTVDGIFWNFGCWRLVLLCFVVFAIWMTDFGAAIPLPRVLGRVATSPLSTFESWWDGAYAPDKSYIGIIPVCFVFTPPSARLESQSL